MSDLFAEVGNDGFGSFTKDEFSFDECFEGVVRPFFLHSPSLFQHAKGFEELLDFPIQNVMSNDEDWSSLESVEYGVIT